MLLGYSSVVWKKQRTHSQDYYIKNIQNFWSCYFKKTCSGKEINSFCEPLCPRSKGRFNLAIVSCLALKALWYIACNLQRILTPLIGAMCPSSFEWVRNSYLFLVLLNMLAPHCFSSALTLNVTSKMKRTINKLRTGRLCNWNCVRR